MTDPRPTVRSPFPKEARLRLDRDFAPVRTRGRRHAGAETMIRTLANGLERARLGVSTPKRYGNAVRRNRFRRVVRAAFRSMTPVLPPRDILVEPRAGLVEPTLAGIAADLLAAAGKASP